MKMVPISIQNNFVTFLHKSLFEHFLAEEIVMNLINVIREWETETSESKSAADKKLKLVVTKILLNQRYLSRDLDVARLLPEAISALSPEIFEVVSNLLFYIIHLSKFSPEIEIGASNAISVLNSLGNSFANQDFEGIRIPFA